MLNQPNAGPAPLTVQAPLPVVCAWITQTRVPCPQEGSAIWRETLIGENSIEAENMEALMDLDDVCLMARVRNECDESFRELMRRYQRQVFQHVYRTTQNAAAAEELTQEVFLRVYLARARYEPTAKLITWLYRIAGNLSLNWIRDHRHETGFASLDAPMARMRTRLEANQVRMLIRKDFERQVRLAVETLPYRQRMAVFLHKYDGMDYGQIAAILGVSVSAVKSMLTRAYTALRASLAPQLEESRTLE